jgi:hypothetical protein
VFPFEGFLSLLLLLHQYLNHFVVFPFPIISLLLNLFNHAYQMNCSFVLKYARSMINMYSELTGMMF